MATPAYAPNATGQPYVPPPPPTGLDPASSADWYNHQDTPASGGMGQMGMHRWRTEGAHAVDDQYQQMYKRWANEGDLDYSGEAQIGQHYDRMRARQLAMDAAMGRSGGGVGSAGQASLYGDQGNAISEYERQVKQARDQRHHEELMSLLGFGRDVSMAELHRKWAKEDSPSFLHQLIGVAGDVIPQLIP